MDVFTDTVFVMGADAIGGGMTSPETFGIGPDTGLRLIDTLADGGAVATGLEEPDQDWQERALCAQTDPEAFFPEKGGSTREAKRICAGCEVRAECLEYALAQDERFGIWGGLSERERRRLRRAG